MNLQDTLILTANEIVAGRPGTRNIQEVVQSPAPWKFRQNGLRKL